MQKIERVFKAASDRNRLRILKLLEAHEMCVCELAFILEIKQPSVSRHLKKLKDAGLIESKQDGLWTNYIIKKNGSVYAKGILSQLRKWLNDDEIILKDKLKSENADRARLCE